ncbi:MAG TPA: hypothetical protein DCM10_08105 [Xanthomarina gelatinilytica]|nr:hypothetical protein [Xanthomarina gelatinilytica]|tara:strand:- start:450 stop:671 length:222 start_codon:yes stop_codon:yes gene_type:complete
MKQAKEVYYFIKSFVKHYGESPTYAEISHYCDIKSKSHVSKIIDHLIEKKLITKGESGRRNLKISGKRYRLLA